MAKSWDEAELTAMDDEQEREVLFAAFDSFRYGAPSFSVKIPCFIYLLASKTSHVCDLSSAPYAANDITTTAYFISKLVRLAICTHMTN